MRVIFQARMTCGVCGAHTRLGRMAEEVTDRGAEEVSSGGSRSSRGSSRGSSSRAVKLDVKRSRRSAALTSCDVLPETVISELGRGWHGCVVAIGERFPIVRGACVPPCAYL